MSDRLSAAVYDEGYAEVYDTIFGTAEHATDTRLLSPVLARVDPGERVLDVGCGTGTLCGLLRRSHPLVEGLDLSEGMLAVARRKNPGLPFTRGDLLDGSLYPAGRFGLVVSEWDVVNYLESVDEYRTAFANFRSWLRTGGWLCLDLLVDQGAPGEGPGALASVMVDTPRLRVEAGWDLRDSAHLVFSERIVTPDAERVTDHHLLLLGRGVIDALLASAGFAVDRNVGDERNPFLCCRAV